MIKGKKMESAHVIQGILEHFHEDEIAMFFENELKHCAKLDLNRTVDVSGYYYAQDDLNKIYPLFKVGCTYIGNAELNIPLLVSIIRSSDSVDVVRNIQSLHTDSLGEDMLTTWIGIDYLIVLLTNVELAKTLRENLKRWKEMGVTEIYLSWYESPELNN